jgi:hypothetical protein
MFWIDPMRRPPNLERGAPLTLQESRQNGSRTDGAQSVLRETVLLGE